MYNEHCFSRRATMKLYDCKLFVTLILWITLCTFPSTNGQRLSQGASDWYMRFHSNFKFIKRNVDRPVTKSFIVDSRIKYRYAITQISSVIHNPATQAQIYNFGFVMPNDALVSDVSITKAKAGTFENLPNAIENAKPYGSSVNTSNFMNILESAIEEGDEDKIEELISERPQHASFNQFIREIHLGPNEEAKISLKYEMLIERENSSYRHVISLSPGERVKDFQVHLSVEDDYPLSFVKVSAPVIGAIAQTDESLKSTAFHTNFSMSLVEQYAHFGTHGFTGDLKLEFDVPRPEPEEADIVFQDEYFAHFYDGPQEAIEDMSSHAMFLIDASLSETKLKLAKEVFVTLLQNMTESDYFNIILFNGKYGETPMHWHPNEEIMQGYVNKEDTVYEAFTVNQDNIGLAVEFVSNMQNDGFNITEENSYLDVAFEHAADLSENIGLSQAISENAVSKVVIITNGMTDPSDVAGDISHMNLYYKLPILALGIGFDANMDTLSALASGASDVAENIIDDMEVEEQLVNIKKHLHGTILKNLQITYQDMEGQEIDATQNIFKSFNRGSTFVVVGKLNPSQMLKTITITGQGLNGDYVQEIAFTQTARHLGCGDAQAILCTEPGFQGECITITNSQDNLNNLEFKRKAVSAKIEGTCSWHAFTKTKYRGDSHILQPGAHEVLHGALFKRISSLKVTPKNEPKTTAKAIDHDANFLARMWASLKVRDSTMNTDLADIPKLIQSAYEASKMNNFLTPYTDLYLNDDEDDVVTYEDLNPVFFQIDDQDHMKKFENLKQCQKPVECKDNFHFEKSVDNNSASAGQGQTCTGTLTLYSRPHFEGDNLIVDSSLSQIYHNTNGQRIRSLKTTGNCCWLLFDHRLFAGNVDKICGNADYPVRKGITGSVKRIGIQSPDSQS